MPLTVKNWRKFQHYHHRRPPWIKLHRELLDDYEFLRLPLASQALAVRLWLIASETDDGSMPHEPGKLAFRLHCSEQEASSAVSALVSGGFLECSPDASNALAQCEQGAILEREIEKSRERVEPEKEPSPAAPAASPDALAAVDYWQQRSDTPLRSAKVRKAYLARADKRLSEGLTLEQLTHAVDAACTDPWFVSQGYPKNPVVIWKDYGRVLELVARLSNGGNPLETKRRSEQQAELDRRNEELRQQDEREARRRIGG